MPGNDPDVALQPQSSDYLARPDTDPGHVHSAASLIGVSATLTPTAVQTANYAASSGQLVLANTSGGGFTVTLPANQPDKTRLAVKLVTAGNTLTLHTSGSDVFDATGGATSMTITTASSMVSLQYDAALGVWLGVASYPSSSAVAGVSSFNTRTGAVTLTSGDLSTAGAALIANNLSDLANAATARTNLGLGSLATASSVAATGDATGTLPGALTLATVNSSPGTTGDASHTSQLTTNAKGLVTANSSVAIQIAESQVTSLVSDLAAKAPLASPALTGVPTAPTATGGTNTTQLATTAFVQAAVGAGGVVGSVFGRTGAVVATSGDYTVGQVTGAAPLASPTFTGTPAAPTAAALTNSTQLATTAYADAAVAVETSRATAAEALLSASLLDGSIVTAATQTASAGYFYGYDTTSNAITVTLPTAPTNASRIVLKIITLGGTNFVTYNTGGTDVINKTGTTSGTLKLLSQAVQLLYFNAATTGLGYGVWYVISDDLPLGQTDARYLQVANNLSDVTAATARTNLGLGTIATLSSTPTADLTTAWPASTVAKIQGTSVGAPTGTAGSAVVLATSPTLTNPVVGTQAATDNSTKAASTAYVTTAIANAVAGVNPAVAVQAATTAAGDTSGLTYNNGVSGVGATFTGTTNTALTIDGYTFTAVGQRLLVKNDTQSPSGAFNGIYYVTQIQTALLPPILTRALDYDQSSDINNTGAIPVVNGTANATTSWLLTSTVNTVGTDPLTYSQFSVAPSSVVTLTGTQTLTNKTLTTAALGSSTATTQSAGDNSTKVATTAYVDRGPGAGWTTFSSTITNFTVGNGTVNGRYVQIGKTVWFVIYVTWGSTTSASGGLTWSLPTTVANNAGDNFSASARAARTGASYRIGAGILVQNTNTFQVVSDGGGSVWSNTNPVTWGTSDYWVINGFYESA